MLRVDTDARLGCARDGDDVVQHRLERPARQLGGGRHGELVPQQTLRAHDDERLAERPMHLAA